MATPTFSTMADLVMTVSMSPDIADYGFKMAATKPELEITFERLLLAISKAAPTFGLNTEDTA